MNSAEKIYLYMKGDIDNGNSEAIEGDINQDNNHDLEYLYSDQTGDVLICYVYKEHHHYRLSLWQDMETIVEGGPEIRTYTFPLDYAQKPHIFTGWHHIFDLRDN